MRIAGQNLLQVFAVSGLLALLVEIIYRTSTGRELLIRELEAVTQYLSLSPAACHQAVKLNF